MLITLPAVMRWSLLRKQKQSDKKYNRFENLSSLRFMVNTSLPRYLEDEFVNASHLPRPNFMDDKLIAVGESQTSRGIRQRVFPRFTPTVSHVSFVTDPLATDPLVTDPLVTDPLSCQPFLHITIVMMKDKPTRRREACRIQVRDVRLCSLNIY